MCGVSECHWGWAHKVICLSTCGGAQTKSKRKTLMACACKHKFAKWRSPVCLLHCGRARKREGEEPSQYFTYYFWDDDWHIKSIEGGERELALSSLALVWCGKGSRKGRHTTGACSPGACLRPCRSGATRRRRRASSLATTAAPFRLIIPITTHIAPCCCMRTVYTLGYHFTHTPAGAHSLATPSKSVSQNFSTHLFLSHFLLFP